MFDSTRTRGFERYSGVGFLLTSRSSCIEMQCFLSPRNYSSIHQGGSISKACQQIYSPPPGFVTKLTTISCNPPSDRDHIRHGAAGSCCTS